MYIIRKCDTCGYYDCCEGNCGEPVTEECEPVDESMGCNHKLVWTACGPKCTQCHGAFNVKEVKL